MRHTVPYQYDNRAFQPDPSNPYIQSGNEQAPTTQPSRPTSRMAEIEAGRTQLHRLLDDVLDKADPDQPYDPDSESERKRRRQQRRMHSEPFDPVVLEPKYAADDQDIGQRYTQSSYRSNPPLFFDDSTLPNRPITIANAYGAQRRPEIDRNSLMRPSGQRQHRFDNDAVYIDTIPKTRDGTRVPIHNAWSERENHMNDERSG